ncbi:unnamed protein product [Adineta steineri]|uniref:LIM zinc-binding domain-containing protein n=1 Tax=Adineta steineri TaxID=433720 RepID=A0A814C6Y5_9BILA|nr:unnamed protein product [Adineta steineri]CAF0936124.1 unnamed protein product [Adineta steineri]CAF0971502.1 unnamed protein product [Adineta steineri]
MSCAKCERPFRHGTDDTITINKKTYHSDCLSCDKCSKAYDGSFSPDDLDKEALCLECTQSERTKKTQENSNTESKNAVSQCGGCGLPFNPASKHITKRYNNKEYHHNCLKCQQCEKLIEGEIYDDDKNNKIYCGSCFKSHDKQGFQKQTQQKEQNQQKSVRFAEKLAETLNRDELAAYYKNEQRDNDESFPMEYPNNHQRIQFCSACMLPFHPGSRVTQAQDKEYHYECFCCEKCRQPINGVFTMNPDGSKFKCGSCLQKNYSSSTTLCTECDLPIETSRIDFNGRSFHVECFTCALCHRRLNPSQTFSLHNDQPWCHQCETDTKYCYTCGKPILSSGIKCEGHDYHKECFPESSCFSCGKPITTAGITYEGHDYHTKCFKCSNCHKLLENEKILCVNNSKPLCVVCNDELFAKRCTKCGKAIPANQKVTLFDDKPFHEQCFQCVKCHRPIGSKKFYKDQRGLICSNCG